jgi:hypothetical protein
MSGCSKRDTDAGRDRPLSGAFMPHPLRRLVLCLLLAAFCAAAPAPVRAQTQQVFAHLFAVPTVMPDGGSPAERTAALESWLAESFGGYTRLGAGVGGWKNETGQVETENNAVYLVTASRDYTKEIAARLGQDFGVRVPYVLVFPAGLFAKRGE